MAGSDTTKPGGGPDASRPVRKAYDSPVRREQVARTRSRILDAACDLVHEFETWDWRPLTFRAVATRAGVGERTVYRHFGSEQVLHHAVMRRLGEQAGISYEGMALSDVATLGAKVVASMASYAAPAVREPDDPALAAEDARRRAALTAAVEASTDGWSGEEVRRAAAALDALWSVYSYRRLVTAWRFDADEAAEVMEWAIDLVVAAIGDDRRPPPPRGSTPPRP